MLVYLTDTKLENVDIGWANDLLLIPYLSFSFTVISFTATSNAFNFIDGVNGLASGIATISLLIISYFCYQEMLTDLMHLSLLLASSTFGFWIVNVIFEEFF